MECYTNPSVNTTDWALMTERGDQGSIGPTGIGLTGPQGFQGNIGTLSFIIY